MTISINRKLENLYFRQPLTKGKIDTLDKVNLITRSINYEKGLREIILLNNYVIDTSEGVDNVSLDYHFEQFPEWVIHSSSVVPLFYTTDAVKFPTGIYDWVLPRINYIWVKDDRTNLESGFSLKLTAVIFPLYNIEQSIPYPDGSLFLKISLMFFNRNNFNAIQNPKT